MMEITSVRTICSSVFVGETAVSCFLLEELCKFMFAKFNTMFSLKSWIPRSTVVMVMPRIAERPMWADWLKKEYDMRGNSDQQKVGF